MPYDDPYKFRSWLKRNRKSNPLLSIVRNTRAKAKKRKIEFSLTYKWACDNYNGKCSLSGLPFKAGSGHGGMNTYSPSIDRINPNKGYTPSNCRVILFGLNALKSSNTDKDMYEIAEALLNNRGKSHINHIG